MAWNLPGAPSQTLMSQMESTKELLVALQATSRLGETSWFWPYQRLLEPQTERCCHIRLIGDGHPVRPGSRHRTATAAAGPRTTTSSYSSRSTGSAPTL
jgi:hypothetical protein